MDKTDETVVYIRLQDLITDANIRKNMDRDELKALADSIANNGQIVPIQVYPTGDKYAVLYGHRRVEACRMLDQAAVRAIVVMQDTAINHIISQYAENEHRAGLSYLERAVVCSRLKEFGMSQREIGIRLGLSDADVSLSLSMLRADPKIQAAVDDGRLKPSAVEPLLSLKPEEQAALADAAIGAKTTKRIYDLVKGHKAIKNARSAAQSVSISDDVDPLELLVIQALENAVKNVSDATLTPLTDPALIARVRQLIGRLSGMVAEMQSYANFYVEEYV